MRRRESRRRRYALRNALRVLNGAIPTMDRPRNCGRYRNGVSPVVSVVVGGDGSARYGGLQNCGSVWACPVCSAKIREGRGREIEAVATAHLEAGMAIAFVTLTVPHGPADSLAGLLGSISPAWHAAGSRAAWGGSADVLGFVRAVEVTRGRNGWHPHLHALLFVRSVADVVRVKRHLESAWADACQAQGLARPNAHGVRVQTVHLVDGRADVGQYLSKVQDDDGASWSVGHEMTRGDLKSGRRKTSETPFDIAAQAASAPEAAVIAGRGCASVDAWREYVMATKGKRAIEWSRSGTWKAHLATLGVAEVAEGEADLAAEDPAAGDRVVFELTDNDHELIRRQRLEAKLLDRAEKTGQAGVLDLLRVAYARERRQNKGSCSTPARGWAGLRLFARAGT